MRLFMNSIKDEIKFILKKPALMILFFFGIPFLTMWLGGTYYNEYVSSIPIAVLDEDNTQLSRQIIQYFDNSERFTISSYVGTRDELQEIIDSKKAYMGLYIPPHFNEDIMRGVSKEVLILTDGSNVIIGNNAYAGAAEIIQTVSAGIEMKVIAAKGGLPKTTSQNMALSFQFADRMLYDPKLTYMNYLIYGFVAVFFQQLMMSSLATLILRDAKETAKEATFIKLSAKITTAAFLLMAVASLTLFMVYHQYHTIYNGRPVLAILISILFAFAISCPTIALCALTKDKIRFSQVAYMLSLPTFLTCGYVWPLDQMPKLLAIGVKCFWPLVNFARPFDELMIKGVSFEVVRQNVINLVLYIIVFMPLSLLLFKRKFNQSLTPDSQGEIESSLQ